MLLLIEPLEDLLAPLHLLLGIIEEIHLESPVFSLLVHLGRHLPVVKRGLFKPHEYGLVNHLEVSKACCELLADKVLLQLMVIFQTQRMMISFLPPMVKSFFELALEPPYDSEKGTVELLDMGGIVCLICLPVLVLSP
jgi:hypothetical protein